jgi:hypothetical protein
MSFLEVYPNASKRPFRNINQGSKWLSEVDDKFLTPMVRLDMAGDVYIHEVCQLDDGSLYVPRRFFWKDQSLCSTGFRVLGHSLHCAIDGSSSPTITISPESYEICVDRVIMSWPRLVQSLGLTSLAGLIGEQQNGNHM